jgi:chromosomal replication initiation ATPase DnaA
MKKEEIETLRRIVYKQDKTVSEIMKHYNITVFDLNNDKRSESSLTEARGAIATHLRISGLSWPKLGHVMFKTRATVIHLVRSTIDRAEVDKNFRATLKGFGISQVKLSSVFKSLNL